MVWILRWVFVFTALVVVCLVHVYLYRRLIRDIFPTEQVRRRWRLGLMGTMLFVLLGTFVFGRSTEHLWTALLFPLWLGVVGNLFLVVAAFEGVRRFTKRRPKEGVSPERRQFLTKAMAATATTAAMGWTSFGMYRAYEPARILEVPVRLPGLPKALEGFTLVHLTDIHIGAVLQRHFLDDLVARANGVRGDLVAITGDLVDGSLQTLGPIVSRLSNLQSKYGTHFVTGNHDYYSGADEWTGMLRGMGIQVLRNRRVSIGDAGGSFDLLGVDDWGHGGQTGDYDLEQATAGRDLSRASVLLAHQPSNFEKVAEAGVGLQLSGHTHGGQTFPGTWVAQMIWGNRNTGLSRIGQSQIFVSRGCGFVGPPQRLGSPPEIAKIVLLAG